MTQIQVRQDTAINWSSNSAITPASGEFCYQTDGDKFVKIGDGSTKFNNLPHFINSTELENKLSDVSKPINYNALKSYADEGELLYDADGLSFVQKYAHSTFDLSKFTVVGSPIITDDGIASGFSGSNYLKLPSIDFSKPFEIIFNENFTSLGAGICDYNAMVNAQDFAYDTHKGYWFFVKINGSFITLGIDQSFGLNANVDLIKFGWDGNYYYSQVKLEGQDWGVKKTTSSTFASPSLSGGVSTASLWLGYNRNALHACDGKYDLKKISITSDGVEVFSGNKTGIDTIKPDDYTVVGTPTISADGVASGFSDTNYLTYSKEVTTFSTIEFYSPIIKVTGTLGGYVFVGDTTTNAIRFGLSAGGDYFYVYAWWLGGGTGEHKQWGVSNVSIGSTYQFKWVVNGTSVDLYVSIDGGEFTPNSGGSATFPNTVVNYNIAGRIGGHTVTGYYFQGGTLDLNSFKIYVDGDLKYQSCLKIPYTESKTGSKIVDAIYRDRVTNMAEQFGYANYYTLSDTDFTLPQVELYGLIGQRTLRDSYRNGINYWELYSNRDLEQGGSCTSGVEVTFARPFADTNYVLSVPYSAKSATAFTPTQTGDWIAKGKGVL